MIRFAPADRRAFTLLEVMIVIVIMAVLAATIIPQFGSSTEDAKRSALKDILHTVRTQIELYKLQHKGVPPDYIDGNGLPQLLRKTNAGGVEGTGSSFPLGPYIQGAWPANPLDGSRWIEEAEQVPPTTATENGGWYYHFGTGQFGANIEGHLND